MLDQLYAVRGVGVEPPRDALREAAVMRSDVELRAATLGRQPGEDDPAVLLLGGAEDSVEVAAAGT